MIRLLTIVMFALFIMVSAGVIVVTVKGSTDETRSKQNIEDTKASMMLTGRFVEHLIVERFGKLYSAAYSGDTDEILKSIVGYTNFIAKTYGHRGDFSVGYMDAGFTVINSINSEKQLCKQSIINEEIASKLLNEKPYVGPVSAECLKSDEDAVNYMMFAVPVYQGNKFQGTVFEISTLLESLNSYKLMNYYSDKVTARIVIDDILRYPRSTQEHELLSIKNRMKPGEILRKGGKLIGFYPFYTNDIKLCIIYTREDLNQSFNFGCCQWLGRNKALFFSLPFILLVLVVILEMIHVNTRLGREVRIRTQHLEDLQKRYRGLFETIPEYVVLYKRDGEILDCNSRFANLLNGGNPIGANINFLIREKERFQRMIAEVEKGGKVPPAEFRLEKTNELESVSVHSCLIDIDNEKAILSVMTDLTDYKKIQNTYYLAQKREVVGTIAAGMVHDFSNILQNISLQYSLLERAKDEDKHEYMKKIESVISGASQYLAAVLSYTKDKQTEPELRKGSEFVKNAIEMAERIVPADVRLEYNDKSGNIKINAVQSKVTQMLINLCQNASDAMDKSGTIFIQTSIVEKPFGHFFCLSVRDSGCGIPEDMVEKVYKPFYTTKKDKGTGLGLATVKQIVLEMGGYIEVKSSSEGTEFILMFSESK